MSLVVIGVDPGSRYTGLVVRLGNDVVDHAVLESTHDQGNRRAIPPMTYVREVIAWVDALKAHVESFGHDVAVGCEGVKAPNMYHDGEKAPLTDPATHMGVAMVFSGVMVAFPDAIEVRPGGHGENLLRSYPAELIGPREKRAFGSGILGHARSAWDIAGVATRVARNPGLRV